ncbi:MAG: phosphoglycerate dehydrogenase [Deferrisomatales bacterium]|nr:phosphoglycerate dehydrogenase [Deferrisomatales bacterium]
MPDTRRILITCDLGSAALERFGQVSEFSVQVQSIKDSAVLADAVAGFHAVIVRSNVQVTAAVLEAGRELQVIGRAGIGVDNIDLEAATRLGVAVVNAPGGNVVTTAEHAIALLMSLARKVPQATASMKDNRWEKKRYLGRELRGKTLGILGVGRVGSVVAELAAGLRMRVIACDPYLSDDHASRLGVERVELDQLLARADCITAHTPLTPDTRGLLGADTLGRVKPGVLVVNCSRGGVVDEDALLEAIESGRVAGAALDVFEVEPPPPHPLYQREEVILTPHLGASTVEAQESVAVEVAENVISYLTTGAAANTLNVPSVPTETLKRLEPYLDLAERLGSFLGQVVPGPVEAARILCRGQAAVEGSALVSAALLKGLLSPALSGRVNTVNAPALARQRGMRVVTSTTEEILDFAELVSVQVVGPWGEHQLDGTLFGRSEPRLVRFDAYRLDALPRGTVILIYNDDVPGVIGAVGTCLGRHQVNIAGMYNGRDAAGGRAICLVNIDAAAPAATLSALRGLPHVQTVQQVFL